MRPISRNLLVAACAAVAGGGAVCAQDAVQATDCERGAYLAPHEGRWAVHRADAPPLEVALPRRFVAYRIEEVGGGWMVTGTVAADERVDIVAWRVGEAGAETLPSPSDRPDRLRANPVPLVENGLLTGLAWMEGERHDALSVLAAEWLGDRWGPVEVVSPPGPGTQIALDAAVLEDGRWLAVWSGFDGQDDEIRWSVRSRDGWSPPRRLGLDNAVPDIAPSLIATRSGALAAWSVYDGEDYRLALAHFDGGSWRLEPPSGARGSLYPRTLRADDRILVLHGTVIPQGWSILELDAEGERIRLLHAGSRMVGRPVVLPRSGDVPELVWPAYPAGGRRAVPLVVETPGDR